jgi:hypothetical protein
MFSMNNNTDNSQRVEVWLPRTFFDDHEHRQLVLHSGPRREYVLRDLKNQVLVSLVVDDINDLWNDALHYAGFTGEDYTWNRSVVDSARRTVAVLEKWASETK